jgi:hypothetical protein
MKGIVYAGCSFTFGHGLEYYSPNNEYIDKPEIQITSINKKILHETREELRFSNIVSKYFNTFDVTRRYTSGSDDDSVLFLSHLFDRSHEHPHITHQRFDYENIEYIVFQTSYPDRCFFNLKNGERFRLSEYQNLKGHISNEIFKVLKENDIDNFKEYYNLLTTQLFNNLKNTLQYYESKNIKCIFWNLTNDFSQHIDNDIWMKERHIKLYHNEKSYMSWKDMFEDNNYDLEIINDKEFFGDVTPKDQHPSKKAHKIISESIIKKIEENEKINQLGKEVL